MTQPITSPECGSKVEFWVSSVIAQKREDFDAMRAFQAQLTCDMQQFITINLTIVAGAITGILSTTGVTVVENLPPAAALITPIIIFAMSILAQQTVRGEFHQKIVRDCIVYAGHRARYIACMEALRLKDIVASGPYAGTRAFDDSMWQQDGVGKGTDQTLRLMTRIQRTGGWVVGIACVFSIAVGIAIASEHFGDGVSASDFLQIIKTT